MKRLETNASAYARETKTVTGAVATLTVALLDNIAAAGTTNNLKAKTVRIAVNTGAIRYTLNGTDPSATVGEVILEEHAWPYRMLSYRQARQLKMHSAASADVEVTYFN